MSHVAGYTCANEGTVRDWLRHSKFNVTQGQNFDLEALAADCAEDGRYAFFLDATPQPFVGGLGTPVNPVAIK